LYQLYHHFTDKAHHGSHGSGAGLAHLRGQCAQTLRLPGLAQRNGGPCGSSGDVAADGLNGDFMVFLMGFHSDFIGFNGD